MAHPWLFWGTVLVMVVAAVCIGAFVYVSKSPARPVVLECEDPECPHVYSQHETNGGRCTGRIRRTQPGGDAGWVPCGCRAYQGVLPPGELA